MITFLHIKITKILGKGSFALKINFCKGSMLLFSNKIAIFVE